MGDFVGAHEPLRKAIFTGNIVIGEKTIPCAVLDDKTRVLSERKVSEALGSKRGGSHWKRMRDVDEDEYLPVFLSAGNLRPFVKPSLAVILSKPIKYRASKGSGSGTNGVDARALPEVCDVYLSARRAGALLPSQEHIAVQAEILMSGLAQVGIISLVDEATGYQAVRRRDELERILERYISKELLPWTKRFPDEFYEEMFRLRGWDYDPKSVKRPSCVGRMTNEIVYERMPTGVLDELKRKNPAVDGRRRHKHHQYLTEDIGDDNLEKQITADIALMRASNNWDGFVRLLDRAYPKPGYPEQDEFEVEFEKEQES
jgi:hypothetical protein